MFDARAFLASLHTAAVQGADPFARTREAVGAWLDGHEAVRARRPDVHLIALGKASLAMARGAQRAVETAGLTVRGGVVVSAHALSQRGNDATALADTLRVRVGDHPVPGPASLDAADAIDDAVHDVDADALPIVLLSGGTTALTAAPVAALSQLLGDVDLAQARLANLADTLLESGLAIHEMNAIRRRVLRWGAGRLAVAIAARGVTHLPVFAISDVIGDDPAVIGSGPCTADPIDDTDFLALLDAHQVRSALEPTMAAFLGASGASAPPAVPPANADAFARVEYQLIARNSDAVAAMAAAARAQGIAHVVVDETPLEGEAAELGDRIARQAMHMARTVPENAAALCLMGGEPVVNLRATYEQAIRDEDERSSARDVDALLAGLDIHVDEAVHRAIDSEVGSAVGRAGRHDDDALRDDADEPMSGGRMQVLALAASLALEDAMFARDPAASRIMLLAAGTDGRDGPTDAAGAIVDAMVPSLARRRQRQPERDLATGRSWFSLDRADALLRTGPTGTNVMDVVAVLVGTP